VDALGEGRHRTAAWLLEQRGENGLWRSYWWLSPLYPTASALRLLAGLGHTRPRGRTLRPTREALRGYVGNGAFETALLLRCRIALHLMDSADALLGLLLDQQNRDGSWPASAHLRLTTPTVHEPWNAVDAGTVYLDRQQILTTATVVDAMAALLRIRSLP
jgi:squalene cyclase